MKSVYLLVGMRPSPIHITHPNVFAAYESRKEAEAESKRRNSSNRTTNRYWVERVPIKMEEQS